ncbi:hypothetical protein CCACVL1_01140, partial [Corchorus capsularis]
ILKTLLNKLVKEGKGKAFNTLVDYYEEIEGFTF